MINLLEFVTGHEMLLAKAWKDRHPRHYRNLKKSFLVNSGVKISIATGFVSSEAAELARQNKTSSGLMFLGDVVGTAMKAGNRDLKLQAARELKRLHGIKLSFVKKKKPAPVN